MLNLSTPSVEFAVAKFSASATLLRTEMSGEYFPMAWSDEQRAKYNVRWSDKPQEQRERYYETRRQQAAEKATAEGREPGRVGRPPRLTAEEKEASRKKQNRRRTLHTMERRSAERAARAIAQGREPGKVGQPRVLTDDQRAVNRRVTQVKHRAENLEHRRALEAEWQRVARAKRALAEGRVPGVIGRLASLSAAALAEYMRSWPDRTDKMHRRLQSQNSRAKKMGVPGTLTLAAVRAVCEEQQAHCAFCAKPFGDETPEIDHWIALAAGGPNTSDNVRLLHALCNRTKGARLPSHYGLPDDPALVRAALIDSSPPVPEGDP